MESLLEYCESERQRKVVTECIKCGNNTAAAKSLGVNVRSVQRCIATVKKNAAK